MSVFKSGEFLNKYDTNKDHPITTKFKHFQITVSIAGHHILFNIGTKYQGQETVA